MQIQDLKLKEVSLFLDLLKIKSVRELARQQRVPPGQISKIIKGLEQKLGVQLLDRSATGVTPTLRTLELVPILEGIQRFEQRLTDQLVLENRRESLTFASTSFFSTHLLPRVFGGLLKADPQTRLRLLDLPPAQFIPAALRGGFQICVHTQNLDWPKTWTSQQIGELSWNMYCRKGHPLTKATEPAEWQKYPFVYPVYWTHEGLRYGDDNFHLSIRKRIRGTETSTAASAAEVVRLSDQIGFFPQIIAREYVKRSDLVELPYRGRESASQPIFLSVKNEVVKQKAFFKIKTICERELT